MKATIIAVGMVLALGGAAWGQFGDGTHLIGTDISPGIYRASGETLCIWQRLSGLGGAYGDVISVGATVGKPAVEIRSSDRAFESRNCGTWRASPDDKATAADGLIQPIELIEAIDDAARDTITAIAWAIIVKVGDPAEIDEMQEAVRILAVYENDDLNEFLLHFLAWFNHAIDHFQD